MEMNKPNDKKKKQQEEAEKALEYLVRFRSAIWKGIKSIFRLVNLTIYIES